MNCNPDFLFIGPQRTGTTWIYEHLIQHPELCFPKNVKETMFFDRNFEKGMGWYKWHFTNCESGQKQGEVAPTYFDDPEVPVRIKENSPECKIIITLRDPVERAKSLYRHHYQKGRVRGTFTEAIEEMPSILTSGFYAEHIPRWLKFFDESKVLVIFMKKISVNPEAVLSDICEFLSVNNMEIKEVIRDEKINSAAEPRFSGLALLGSKIVSKLHYHRLHILVNFAKKIGLKKLFFRNSSNLPDLTDEERAYLEEKFGPHVKYAREKFGKSIL